MKRIAMLFAGLLLLTACGEKKSEAVKVEQSRGAEVFQQTMPNDGKVVSETYGEEVWFAFGPITGVDDLYANGVALAHYFEDGTYTHTVQLNIDPAEEGYFYEGWVVQKGKEPVSTGHLSSHFGDARHFLKFESREDLRKYTQVIITLEADDGDPAPAGHVAEGDLIVTAR